MRGITLFLLLFFLPIAVHANPPHWRIDPAHSHITFAGTVMGQAFTGEFKKFGGDIQFDINQLAQSRADITVEIASAITDNDDANQYMGAAEWFDTAHFTTAHFTANRFEKTGTDSFIAHGMLRIRNTTLPVDLPFTLTNMPGDQHVQMQSEITLNRLDYQLGAGPWAGPETVGWGVRLSLRILSSALKP